MNSFNRLYQEIRREESPPQRTPSNNISTDALLKEIKTAATKPPYLQTAKSILSTSGLPRDQIGFLKTHLFRRGWRGYLLPPLNAATINEINIMFQREELKKHEKKELSSACRSWRTSELMKEAFLLLKTPRSAFISCLWLQKHDSQTPNEQAGAFLEQNVKSKRKSLYGVFDFNWFGN